VGSFPTFAALFLNFALAAPVSIFVAFVALRNLELGDVPVCMVVAAVCIHSKPDDSVRYLYIIDEDDQGLVCFCWVRCHGGVWSDYGLRRQGDQGWRTKLEFMVDI